jgi:membrane-anchored protein YejM (alkaline phosphatase superfamily)
MFGDLGCKLKAIFFFNIVLSLLLELRLTFHNRLACSSVGIFFLPASIIAYYILLSFQHICLNSAATYLIGNIPVYQPYVITTIKKTANLVLGFRTVEIQILSSYSEKTNSPLYAVLIEQILTAPSSVAAQCKA